MKEKMSLNRNRDKDITANQPLLDNNNQTLTNSGTTFNDNCNNLIANNCINNNIATCNSNSASSFTVSVIIDDYNERAKHMQICENRMIQKIDMLQKIILILQNFVC